MSESKEAGGDWEWIEDEEMNKREEVTSERSVVYVYRNDSNG